MRKPGRTVESVRLGPASYGLVVGVGLAMLDVDAVNVEAASAGGNEGEASSLLVVGVSSSLNEVAAMEVGKKVS